VFKELNLNRGFIRLFIALSLIWFSYFIYQSYKYLYDPWESSVTKISHPERDMSKYKNYVCDSWNKETFEKLKDPKRYINLKNPKNIDTEWFGTNTDKIEFVSTTDFTYPEYYRNYWCQFEFRKPRPFKDRITFQTKKYFYYSLFPMPIYLLIIFVVNGFRRQNQ